MLMEKFFTVALLRAENKEGRICFLVFQDGGPANPLSPFVIYLVDNCRVLAFSNIFLTLEIFF